MRIQCPKCEAAYEVSADAIGPNGRTVRCASCANEWFEAGEGTPGPTPLAEQGLAAPTPGAAAVKEARDEFQDIVGVVAGMGAAKSTDIASEIKAATRPGAEEVFEDVDPPRSEALAAEAAPEARKRVRSGDAKTEESFEDLNDPALRPQSGGAFLAGFATVTLVALLMIATYVKAPEIAEALPAAKAPLDAYTGVVDQGRLALLKATGER
ncbi:MAG: MJ0042-type zinc finger domain-containing protein [Pseudomonadota bacterium]